VILLNPRLIEYDLAPITLPLAMIAFRHIVASAHRVWQAATAITLLVAAGYLSNASWFESKWAECLILVCVFALGSRRLLDRSRVIVAVPAPESVG